MKLFLMILTISIFIFSGCDDGSDGNNTNPDSNNNVTDNDSAVIPDETENSSDSETLNDADIPETSDTETNDESAVPDADSGTAISGKYCIQYCDSAADCAAESAISDENNWSCDSNHRCTYTGCVSTDECQSAYQSTDYGCNPNGSYGYGECAKFCNTAGDCSLGSVMYDEDNYECNNSFCVFKGCNSDAECAEGMNYAEGTWKCYELAGISIKTCQLACTVDTDCSDSGKYMCNDGRCVTKTCENDEWCGLEYGEKYKCMNVN